MKMLELEVEALARHPFGIFAAGAIVCMNQV